LNSQIQTEQLYPILRSFGQAHEFQPEYDAHKVFLKMQNNYLKAIAHGPLTISINEACQVLNLYSRIGASSHSALYEEMAY